MEPKKSGSSTWTSCRTSDKYEARAPLSSWRLFASLDNTVVHNKGKPSGLKLLKKKLTLEFIQNKILGLYMIR